MVLPLTALQVMVCNNISNMKATIDGTDDLLKRWQKLSPNLFDIVQHAQPGDIFLKKQHNPYSPLELLNSFEIHHYLSKLSFKTERTSYIGFVDFEIDFDYIDSIKFDGEPVRVFCYEKEPFCVVKSMIIMEMIQDFDVTPRSIVEVWLSKYCSSIFQESNESYVGY